MSPAPLAVSQLSAAMTAVSGPKKGGASQHKKRVLKHGDFKKIVGKFWSAMTDNGALEAVSFSLYFVSALSRCSSLPGLSPA